MGIWIFLSVNGIAKTYLNPHILGLDDLPVMVVAVACMIISK